MKLRVTVTPSPLYDVHETITVRVDIEKEFTVYLNIEAHFRLIFKVTVRRSYALKLISRQW
jgi:hypothetical protein